MAEAGVSSRRRCKELVLTGKVKVNEQAATSAGDQIDPEKDAIEVNGKRILLSYDEKIYILLNKPAGYLSTTADQRGRKTVMDLIPPQAFGKSLSKSASVNATRASAPSVDKRLYPVGRLDMDTEGLLVITNDGDLTYLLTHPKHNINKVYLAWVKGTPTDESLNKLRQGVMLEDGLTAPALVEREGSIGGNCLRIAIHEGRKRQIRRMCVTIGHRVQKLIRIKLGPIELGDLSPGDYRYLSKDEVEALKNQNE